jgi:hypothetical protein
LRKNCKNREKIAKNARKLMKKCKNARQIVENGVDQVDLVEVPLPETKKEKKNGRGDFFEEGKRRVKCM